VVPYRFTCLDSMGGASRHSLTFLSLYNIKDINNLNVICGCTMNDSHHPLNILIVYAKVKCSFFYSFSVKYSILYTLYKLILHVSDRQRQRFSEQYWVRRILHIFGLTNNDIKLVICRVGIHKANYTL
jgi:hypothetical protein